MAHAPRWSRPALLIASLGTIVAGLGLGLAAADADAPGRITAPRGAAGVSPAAAGAAAQPGRTEADQDLGCWGAVIGSRFRHHVDDRCTFAIDSAEGGRHPGGTLHASCDVSTVVLDRRDDEVLAQCLLEGLQFFDEGGRAVQADELQAHLVAATQQPVLLRLGARGELRGFGFADGLDGDQRNFLRGTLGLFCLEAPPAPEHEWSAHAVDTTGEFDARYQLLANDRELITVRRTKLRYTSVVGQEPVPEHELRGVAEGTFVRRLGWLGSAQLHDGMTLALPLMELRSISDRHASITLVDAGVAAIDVDVAAAWARATAAVSGAGERLGGYAAGNERRRWQELLRGVTLQQLLADLQQVLATEPVDAEALDGVFQKLQWMVQLDDGVAAEIAARLATQQLDSSAAPVALGALGAAGTPAAQRALAAVRADQGLTVAVREAATIACIQLAEPDGALVADMVRDAAGESQLRGTSMLVLGAVASRAGQPLADGRSPSEALLAMEGAAAARGELSTWLLAVANDNPPETLSIAVRLLGHVDADVRAAACVALRAQPAATALHELVERGLGDLTVAVRLEALLALARRSEPAAREAIQRVASADPDQAIRERAQRLLQGE